MRNFSGRVIGGVLIAIAVAWILQLAGAFPFRSGTRTANQFVEDRPPVQDPNAFVTGTTTTDRQPVQSFQADGTTRIAQDPATPPAPPENGTTTTGTSGYGTGTTSTGTTSTGTASTPGGTTSTATTSPETGYTGAPAVRAGW